jgi:hypothetical protein
MKSFKKERCHYTKKIEVSRFQILAYIIDENNDFW